MTNEASSKFAIAGIVIGLLSILAGSLHFFLGPIEKTPTLENVVQEKTAALKDAIIAGIKGEPTTAEPQRRQLSGDDIARAATIGTGILALALGIVGLVRREPMRESAAAMAVGGAAVVLPFAVYAVMLILGMMLIVSIIGAVGDVFSF
ncbi:MAG: hypothetical protein AAF004_00985 [Pseudomonadota bacterium]